MSGGIVVRVWVIGFNFVYYYPGGGRELSSFVVCERKSASFLAVVSDVNAEKEKNQSIALSHSFSISLSLVS